MLDEFMKTKARALRDFSSDDILNALGLERRHTALDAAMPAALAFVAGLAAGAGVALLLAPKSGREIRADISNKASELTGKLTSTANELVSDVRSALPLQTSERGNADPTRTLSGSTRTS
jgi:hypothetical protein